MTAKAHEIAEKLDPIYKELQKKADAFIKASKEHHTAHEAAEACYWKKPKKDAESVKKWGEDLQILGKAEERTETAKACAHFNVEQVARRYCDNLAELVRPYWLTIREKRGTETLAQIINAHNLGENNKDYSARAVRFSVSLDGGTIYADKSKSWETWKIYAIFGGACGLSTHIYAYFNGEDTENKTTHTAHAFACLTVAQYSAKVRKLAEIYNKAKKLAQEQRATGGDLFEYGYCKGFRVVKD